MAKAKLTVIFLFLLALGSGLVAGMLVSRWPASRPADARASTPLAAELGLTKEQNDKMRRIWEDVRDEVDTCFLRAQEAQKRRDDVLVSLLNNEQKAKFAQAQQECAAALASLKAERDAMFQEAVKRTERLLSEPQRKRYREILAGRLGRDPAGGPPDWIPPQTPPQRPGAAPTTERE